MIARTKADITIYRKVNGVETEILTAPITESSVRKFKLMEDNSIVLKFCSEIAKEIRVGDYINDELFGVFYSKSEQVSTYNTNNGGYDYELTFVSLEMLWSNIKCMLPVSFTDGTKSRKEMSWTLTDVLKNHLQQIRQNLVALGLDVNVCISVDIEKQMDAVSVSYSGVTIFDALKSLCDLYECEWWYYEECIYVGKCENWKGATLNATTEDGVFTWEPTDDDALTFETGVNVEKMTCQKDQKTYANRLFVFGGTQNVPYTYRKKLTFKCDRSFYDTDTGALFFRDTSKTIYTSYIVDETTETKIQVDLSGYSFEDHDDSPKSSASIGKSISFKEDVKFTLNGKIGLRFQLRPSAIMSFKAVYRIWLKDADAASPYFDSDSIVLYQKEFDYWSIDFRTASKFVYQRLDLTSLGNSDMVDVPAGNYKMYWGIDVTDSEEVEGINQCDTYGCGGDYDGIMTLTFPEEGVKRFATIIFNDTAYRVCFNPYKKNYDDEESYSFEFVDSSGAPTSVPSGWGVDSEYTMPFAYESTAIYGGLNVTKIPLSYWTGEYDNPFSLLSIGQQRLMLPVGNYPEGYIQTETLITQALAESCAVFENIYPRCVLKVESITKTEQKYTTEYNDGSTVKTGYAEYNIKVVQIDGTEFPYKSSYQADGYTLSMSFVTESSLTDDEKVYLENGSAKTSKLAGMTFECNYENGGFLLITNQDYGTILPNSVLLPEEGDVCVLTNWDVRAMPSLYLIEDAENRLMVKGEEYFNELQDNHFTFTCQMMSDDLIRQKLIDSNNLNMVEGEYIYVKGDNTVSGGYSLPEEGNKVIIKSDVLRDGQKVSRVIGYEFKLDIPYDTPSYTIGETDAYSRLKKLEKEITKL